MMTDNSVAKERAVLKFIQEFFAEYGYAPSFRDIMAGANISSTSYTGHLLDELVRQGHLTRDYNVPRSIVLMDIND